MKLKFLIPSLIVLVASLLFVTSSSAQEFPLYLYEVAPSEGRAGEYLELRLWGDGFQRAEIVRVEIEGVEVREFWVESNEEIGADIYIPEDAPPGSRPVVVHGSLGEFGPIEAVLEEGFFILEREEVIPTEELPPDEPTPYEPQVEPPYYSPEPEFPWWIVILVLGGLGFMGVVAITLIVTIRRASLKQTWQQQASSQELPKNCHPTTYVNRREKIELKPGRWKITSMKVSLYDSARNVRGKTYSVPGDLVSKFDKAARQRLLTGEDDRLRSEIVEMAKELSALVVAWQAISEKGKDAYLEAHLEGGSAEATFARYHCVGQPGQWRKVLEWTAKLKAVDYLPATFRAPLDGDSQPTYQAFLSQQFDAYLTNLVKEAARLL